VIYQPGEQDLFFYVGNATRIHKYIAIANKHAVHSITR